MSKNMKKLTRSRNDKWLGGVCGGIAEYTGIDTNIIRLLVVVGTVLGAGSLVIAYIVALFLIPLKDDTTYVDPNPSTPSS